MSSTQDKRSPQERAAIVKAYMSGKSATQVALEFGGGLTRNAVIGLVNRAGQKRSPEATLQAQVYGARMRAQSMPRKPPKPPPPSKAVAMKPPPPPKPPPPTPTDPIPLLMLPRFDACRWPFDVPGGYLFCGAVCEGSYCPTHRRMAYAPVQPKKVRLGGRETRT